MSHQTNFLYFSLMPQALIASMLPPEEFGKYMTGTRGRMAPSGQQAIFFEVDLELVREVPYFDFKNLEKELVLKNGEPKKSFHISQYRVLEHLPFEAFKSLYLTTSSGAVLELHRTAFIDNRNSRSFFLFQLLSPRAVMVASKLRPVDFICRFTNRQAQVHFPKVLMVDLDLGELAFDPSSEKVDNLPYKGLDNLKDCLATLVDENKKTKMVDRDSSGIHWRMIKTGFYVGNEQFIIFYPFPEKTFLQSTYYDWFRHAEKDNS